MKVFMAITVIGQLIFTLSSFQFWEIHQLRFAFAFAGRLLLGIGGESLMTLFCVLVTKWFYMQEFSFSYGMFISVGKLTNVACSYLTPVLANEKIGYASLVGLIIMTLSAISGYIFTLFEKHAVKIENLEFFSQSIVEEKYSLRGIIKLGTQYWFLTFNVTLGYIGFYSFETISQDFLLQRY